MKNENQLSIFYKNFQNLLKNSLDTNKIMEEEFDFSKFFLVI